MSNLTNTCNHNVKEWALPTISTLSHGAAQLQYG